MDSLTIKDSIFKEKHIKEYDLSRIDTFFVGDVNGDNINDTAFIQPLSFFVYHEKIDSQYVNISFSCPIPAIKHYNGIHGTIANAGDLNGDKKDEIIYHPDWYQSNEGAIYVYGYNGNTWQKLAVGSLRNDVIDETKDREAFLRSRVKKINNHSFQLIQHLWRPEDTFYRDSITVIKI